MKWCKYVCNVQSVIKTPGESVEWVQILEACQELNCKSEIQSKNSKSNVFE